MAIAINKKCLDLQLFYFLSYSVSIWVLCLYEVVHKCLLNDFCDDAY